MCEVFPSWGLLVVDWWAKPLGQPWEIPGVPLLWLAAGSFGSSRAGGGGLAGQQLELVVAVLWLLAHVWFLSWARGTWLLSQLLFLAMGPQRYNFAPALGPKKWARLVAQPEAGTSIPSQPTELQGYSGKSLVTCWSVCKPFFALSAPSCVCLSCCSFSCLSCWFLSWFLQTWGKVKLQFFLCKKFKLLNISY